MKKKHKKTKKRKNYNRMKKADLPMKSELTGKEFNSKYWSNQMWNLK